MSPPHFENPVSIDIAPFEQSKIINPPTPFFVSTKAPWSVITMPDLGFLGTQSSGVTAKFNENNSACNYFLHKPIGLMQGNWLIKRVWTILLWRTAICKECSL